jgi:hypothetical protein
MEHITFNLEALKIVAKRYGFTSQYIKTILWGTRTPKFADQIKKEYYDMIVQLETLADTKLKPI